MVTWAHIRGCSENYGECCVQSLLMAAAHRESAQSGQGTCPWRTASGPAILGAGPSFGVLGDTQHSGKRFVSGI